MNQKTLVEKYLLWALYFVLFMTPVIFLPFVYRQFDIGKSVPFKISVGLLTIVFCAWQIFKPKAELWSQRIRYLFPFLLPIALYVLSYLFSSFLSDDLWMSFSGLYERQIGTSGFLLCVLFAFYLVLFTDKAESYHLGLKVFKIMTFAIGLASVMQYLNIYDFMLRDPPGGRSNALLGNANFLGNQIVFFAPLFLSSYFLSKNKQEKVFNILFFLICALGILVTGTRGAYLALGGSFLVFLFLLVLINDKEEKFQVNYYIILFLFSLLTFIFSSLMAVQWSNLIFFGLGFLFFLFTTLGFFKTIEKFTGKTWKKVLPYFLSLTLACSLLAGIGSQFRSQAGFVDRYYSVYDFTGKAAPRFMIWKDGLDFVKDIPLWGIGPELFRIKFMSYKSAETEVLEPHTHYDNPHNNYLYILFSLGPVGLLIHLWIMGRFFRLNFNLLRDKSLGRQERLIAAGFFSVMASYAIWTFPGFEFLSSIVSFWSLIGLFCIFYGSLKRTDSFWEFRFFTWGQKVNSFWQKRFVQVISFTFAIVLSVWLIWDNYCIYEGDASFVKGLIERGRGDFKTSNEFFEKALSYNPKESYYFLHIAKNYAELIRTEPDFEMKRRYLYKGEDVLDQGLKHAWSPDLFYATKANLRLGIGDRQGAIDAMMKVLEVYPATIEYRKFLNYIQNEVR